MPAGGADARAVRASAQAQEALARTIGGWTVNATRPRPAGASASCATTRTAGPRSSRCGCSHSRCTPASREAEGLVRVADLDLPPRSRSSFSLAPQAVTIEGVGRHGRLAARFAMPTHELPQIAAADRVTMRFTDQATYSSKRPVASRSRSYRLVSGNGGNQDFATDHPELVGWPQLVRGIQGS